MVKLGYPLLPPGIAKVKVGDFYRSSAGAQAITGVGFTPKVVIFLAYASGGATEIHSHGFDNVAAHRCINKPGSSEAVVGQNAYSIYLQLDAGNIIRGYLASMDADGFTVTWELTGTLTGYVIYLAMR